MQDTIEKDEGRILTKCINEAHKNGFETEKAIKCEGELACENCPYNFDY